MLLDCALDPQALADLQSQSDLRLLLHIFSFDRPARPCAIPTKSEWSEQVRDALKNACRGNLVARQCLPDLFMRLQKLAVFRLNPRAAVHGLSWVNSARAAHAERPFQWLVTPTKFKPAPPQLKSTEEFLQDDHDAQSGSSEIDRKAEQLARLIGGFVQWSEKVVIVDPYAGPQKGIVNTLQWLVQKQPLHRPAEFTIVCDLRHQGATREQLKIAATAELHRLAPLGISRTWRFVGNPRYADWAMHDRFLLTNIGGLLSGAGFDPVRGKTTVSLLDESHLAAKQREFGSDLSRRAEVFDVVVRDP